MAEVFISYSRNDGGFVRAVHAELKRAGREPWVDWTGIPPTAAFMEEIRSAIEASDHFVFVLSPDSIKSEVCRVELEHAVACEKRLVPIVCRDVAPADVPEPLRDLNWLYLRPEDDFKPAVQQLLAAIDLDLEWIRSHTRVLLRALEWDRNGRDRSFLLRGVDLQRAVSWIAESGDNRSPTELQQQYVNASQDAERTEIERLNRLLEEAREQRRIAESERGKARRQLAESLLAQGDALGQLHRWPEASDLYSRASLITRELDASPVMAQIGLWNAQRHSPSALCEIPAHKGRILDAAFAADEGLIVSAGADGTVRFWDFLIGTERYPALRPEGGLGRARICPSQDTILLWSGNIDRVERWSLSERSIRGHWTTSDTVTAIAIAPSRDALLLASGSGQLELHEEADGAVRWRSQAHASLVTAVAFSPCGRYVVSGSMGLGRLNEKTLNLAGGVVEPTLRLWDSRTGLRVHDFDDYRVPVNDIAFTPQGNWMITAATPHGGMQGVLDVWDFKSESRLRRIEQGVFGHRNAAVSPGGNAVLSTGGTPHTLWEWDVQTGWPQRVYDAGPHEIDQPALSAKGHFVLGVGDGGRIVVWPREAREESRTLGRGIGCLRAVAFSPDGRLAATGSAVSLAEAMSGSPVATALAQGRLRCPIHVWDVGTGCLVWRMEGHASNVTALAFGADGGTLLSVGLDRRLSVWDLDTGTCRRRIDLRYRWAATASLCTDNRTAYIGLQDGAIEQWDLEDGVSLGEIEAHSDLVQGTSLVDNERRLVSLGRDGFVRFWKAGTGDPDGELQVGDDMTALAVNDHGTVLLTGDRRGRLHVWSLVEHQELGSFPGHAEAVESVALSPDGLIAASGGRDSRVKLWNVETGRELLSFDEHGAVALALTFSPDGVRLLTGSDDQSAMLLDFSRPPTYASFRDRLSGVVDGRLEDSDAKALATWGEWLLFRGFPMDALRQFERARSVDPSVVSATTLGLCFWRAGNRTKARELLEPVAASESKESQHLRMIVRSLTGGPGPTDEADQDATAVGNRCPRCGRRSLTERSERCAVCGVALADWLARRSIEVIESLMQMEGVAYEKINGPTAAGTATRPPPAPPPEAEVPPRPESGEPGIPGRPVLYAFQHVTLRDAAFENHPELVRELAGPRSVLPLLHFRSKAELHCERMGWKELGGPEDDAAYEAQAALFEAVRIHRYQGDGFTVHVVAMPTPQFNTEAYFVAIVHRDGERSEYMRPSPSTRYFTLEKTRIADRPLLCEWHADGTRANHGEGPEADIDLFVEAVLGHLRR